MRIDAFRANPWEYTPPGQKGALQYLTIAVTTVCNFRCSFCSKAGLKPRHLDGALLWDILDEAVELGLEKVEFTGGEPLLYPGLLDLVDELRSRGVTSLLVTNGSVLSGGSAARLARAGAMVAVSLSTLDEKKFAEMTGTRGRLSSVTRGVGLLRRAGFGSQRAPLLAVQSVASRENLEELPALGAWARAHDCLFILNRPIPVGAMGRDSLIPPQAQQFL